MELGDENYNVALPHGTYQATGSINAAVPECVAKQLPRPITLVPLPASYSSIKYASPPTRLLRWEITSDLPVEHYTFTPEDSPTETLDPGSRSKVLFLGGDQPGIPAPLEKVFTHQVRYIGVNDIDNPQPASFVISLADFLPQNVTHVNDLTQITFNWKTPVNDLPITEYQISTPSIANTVLTANIANDNKSNHSYTFKFDGFLPGETALFKLGTIFMNETDGNLWWGPVHIESVHFFPVSTPAPTPTGIPPGNGTETFIRDVAVIGATTAGTIIVVAVVATVGVVIYLCKKKKTANSFELEEPADDN